MKMLDYNNHEFITLNAHLKRLVSRQEDITEELSERVAKDILLVNNI